MLKVGQLQSFLSTNQGRLTPSQKAFAQFLRSQHDEEFLSIDLLQEFFETCLLWEQWRKASRELTQDLCQLLESEHLVARLPFDLKEVRWPIDQQVLSLENSQDAQAVIFNFLRPKYNQGEKIKVLEESPQRFLAFVLHANKKVEVYSLTNLMILKNGFLSPLLSESRIEFTAQLELAKNQRFRWLMDAQTWTDFSVSNSGHIQGQIFRGPGLVRISTLENTDLTQTPALYYSIKRVEQFLIDRRSDRLYQQLIHQLEKWRDLSHLSDPQVRESASDVLLKAEAALECIYKEDKLLLLMKRELESHFSIAKPANLNEIAGPQSESSPMDRISWQNHKQFDLIN